MCLNLVFFVGHPESSSGQAMLPARRRLVCNESFP